jgi:hypothetical protein
MPLYVQTSFVLYKDTGEIDASYLPGVLLSPAYFSQHPMEAPSTPGSVTKGKKDQRFQMRCSPSDRQKIEELAKKAGKNLSEYMIDAALNAPIRERMPAELQRQLSATSKKLNQLTRLANAGKLNARGVAMLEQILAGLYQSLV